MKILEVCVDNYESALLAAKSGADRLELCQDLSVGGLTPTAGFIKVVKSLVSIPVFVLIRPRSGNFIYSSYEVDQMLQDIEISKQMGADGLVFGALNKHVHIDKDICQLLLAASYGLPVTFHRAFDLIMDKRSALEEVIQLGFDRILTSGGPSVTEGIDVLKDLVLQAGNRIIIMPGGGVTNSNIVHTLHMTKAAEFHSSGRTSSTSKTCSHGTSYNVCSEKIIQDMRKVLGDCIVY